MSTTLGKKATLFATIALACLCTTASAQNNRRENKERNPYANRSYYRPVEKSRSFGTFYAEYNRMKMDAGTDQTPTYNGVSVGFSYFVPVVGGLGLNTGMKVQYFFRNEKENIITWKDNLLAGTVPVDLAFDLRLGDKFSIIPYAGMYGRCNFSAKAAWEQSGMNGRTSVNLFDSDQIDYYNSTFNTGLNKMKRFQFGWEAGAMVRLSEIVTIGGGYWHDLNKIAPSTKLYGFNVQLGVNF